jgi:hypothetical protein
LIETTEKWKLRNQEAPPPRKSAPISLDVNDIDDAPRRGRNNGRSGGRRKEKSEVKRRAEQERLMKKIDEMMKLRQK